MKGVRVSQNPSARKGNINFTVDITIVGITLDMEKPLEKRICHEANNWEKGNVEEDQPTPTPLGLGQQFCE